MSDSLANYWAGSASQSVQDSIAAGRVVILDGCDDPLRLHDANGVALGLATQAQIAQSLASDDGASCIVDGVEHFVY